MRALAVLLLTFSITASATPSGDKRAQRKLETDRVVQTLLQGANVESVVARVQYLGEQPRAAEWIAVALRDTFEDAPRRSLAQALALLAARTSENTLLKLTEDDDAVVRMYGAQGLGRVRSRASKALLPLLADASMPVRREAAIALGAQHQPALGKPLMKAAKAEGEPEVRVALLVAVGQSGDRKQTKELEAFLNNSSELTRFAAARGLCGLGAPSGFAFARKLLASQDKYERRGGLELFEGFPAKTISSELKPLLADPDKALAARAARILYEGGDPKMLDWLVMASFNAKGDEKLTIEDQLDKLHLADDQRRAILTRNGVP